MYDGSGLEFIRELKKEVLYHESDIMPSSEGHGVDGNRTSLVGFPQFIPLRENPIGM